ncbi:MAG: helix-turn-helix domain-containing protein [Eubacterium sp.]|nr:helix-turn-helix domain-containing protein [Eubacterium sp.]
MFGDNLKTIRKAKSYTQKELAIKLNVVRQTVSKWEKGLSVPDADTLCKIADALETSISELLGSEINTEINRNEVAEQLAKISEQLAIKNRCSKKIWKIIGIILLAIIVVKIIWVALGMIAFNSYKYSENSTVIEENMEEILPEEN